MNYIFYTKTIDTTNTTYYLVDIKDDNTILTNLDFTIKNFSELKTLINGIEQSKTKPKGEEYIWANEDVTVNANENGILLIDMLAQRAGIYDPDIITLRLEHNEFITFLQDFKKFIKENS